jgi:hypothetical protein
VLNRVVRRLARGELAKQSEAISALSEHRDRLRAERDRARGRLSELNQDARLGYVFVVTYGRSGSTLVQGLLNSIPGYLVRGENRQILRHLWAYDKAGTTERRVQRRKERGRGVEEGSSEPTSPLFGMDNFAHLAALRQARKMAVATILRPEPDTRVTGFKEILWDEPDTPEFVAWLQEVFPGAKFVINTRDLSDVSKSAWWSEDPGAYEALQANEALLLGLLETLGDAAYRIKYDEFTKDPAVLRGLYEWLGEPFDEDAVRAVLNVRHSFRAKTRRRTSED